MGTRAFLEADVLASGHSKQETLWLYGGKARWLDACRTKRLSVGMGHWYPLYISLLSGQWF